MASKYARRSLLYMPGSSMKMLQKAVTLRPDAVILDLEDAVSISEKELARRQVVEMLPQIKASGKEVLVRVNGMDTSWGVEDLQAVVGVLDVAVDCCRGRPLVLQEHPEGLDVGLVLPAVHVRACRFTF